MSERQFVYYHKDGTPSGSVSFAVLREKANARVVQGDGPFTLTQDGDILGQPSETRSTVLDHMFRRLKAGSTGPVYRVRGGADDVVFRCREVVAAIDLIDTSGNDKADVYWSTIADQFSEYEPRFAGAYVCKNVSGTTTKSQHSYGNAVDIFFDTLAHQEEVARWAVAHADELHLQTVISGDRIWTRGEGWRDYGGDFHSHLHVDFAPSQSGPCGVKG